MTLTLQTSALSSENCTCIFLVKEHLDARADDGALDIKGEAKVEMKEGSTKGNGLPCVAAIFIWNPAPESKNEEAKLLRGAGTPLEAAGEAGVAETAALDST